MSGRPCVEDGNATACYMFLVCILPLHGIPICLFALELFFPQFFQRFEATRRLRDTQRFVWTMKRLYRSSYGDIWKAGACMWLISVWTPVGIALQLFLPGYQISNDESSMNGTTCCYYVMVFVMMVSGTLSSLTLSQRGRLAYARERYHMSANCPVEVPYKSNVKTGEDVYLALQRNYAALLLSKKIKPKGRNILRTIHTHTFKTLLANSSVSSLQPLSDSVNHVCMIQMYLRPHLISLDSGKQTNPYIYKTRMNRRHCPRGGCRYSSGGLSAICGSI